jgi:hypothetical protein
MKRVSAGPEDQVRAQGARQHAVLAAGREHLFLGDALGLGVGGREGARVGQALVAVLDALALVHDARRADVDQARDPAALAGAQHVARAAEVDLAHEVDAAALGVHERGVVDDDVLAGDGVLDDLRVAHVGADELHVGAPLGDGVVEHGDAVAAVGEGVDDRATEEAAAAGDEDSAGCGAGVGHGTARIEQGRGAVSDRRA